MSCHHLPQQDPAERLSPFAAAGRRGLTPRVLDNVLDRLADALDHPDGHADAALNDVPGRIGDHLRELATDLHDEVEVLCGGPLRDWVELAHRRAAAAGLAADPMGLAQADWPRVVTSVPEPPGGLFAEAERDARRLALTLHALHHLLMAAAHQAAHPRRDAGRAGTGGEEPRPPVVRTRPGPGQAGGRESR